METKRTKTRSFLGTVALTGLACTAIASAQTTTFSGAAATDSWNTPANWDNGLPAGTINAIVAPGKTAGVLNAATPTYSGSLTLESNAVLDIGNLGGSQNAATASGIILKAGAKLQWNIDANITFPPMTLAGNASWVTPFGASDDQTDNFGAITGSYPLTINGFNNHTFNLNATNTFTQLNCDAIDRYNIRAKAAGALGTGNVIVNQRGNQVNPERSARLYFDVPAVMADTATLYLNGPVNGGGFAGDGVDWVVINHAGNEKISALYIYGVKQAAGTYTSAEKWLGGSGTLTVEPITPNNPAPAFGAIVPAGSVQLTWTNLPPTTGSDVWVDVWFGTDPQALSQVAAGQLNLSSFTVNAPTGGTYYWRVDSYLNGTPTGTSLTGTRLSFVVTDTDGDGFPDAYELAHTTPASTTALNRDDDLEPDGLTNWQEYQRGTLPNNPDTDGDTLNDGPETAGVGSRPPTDPLKLDTDGDNLSDGIESNTGTWVGTTNTGTNPADKDSDKDALTDTVETNTGIYVSKTNTGTHPLLSDTDTDGAGDWYEITASFTNPLVAASKPNVPYPLPDPDGSTGATNKPVKVYIMSGQSNMVGAGTVSGTDSKALTTMTRTENKFPNLIDSAGNFIARQDVRYRGVITAIGNGPLAPGFGSGSNTFGPELGFGQVMGWSHDEPVLLLKSSQGNRSLGWDFLPPGSPSSVYGTTNYPGYGGFGTWPVGGQPPTTGGWYAGLEYDECFLNEADMHPNAATLVGSRVNVVDILDNWIAEYSGPGKPFAGQDFEIAGFVWWQGDKDRYDMALATRYEQNLVKLITTLRSYYTNRYPGKVVANAPFVLATLGQTPLNETDPEDRAILDGMLAVDDYPQFVGNVKTVYAHPLSEGGASNSHYDGRAGTYMLVGDALGRAMVGLEAGATGDPLLDAIAALKGHINGTVTLSAAQISEYKLTLDVEKGRFATSATAIAAAFDLVTTYDNVLGPLFVARSLPARASLTNDLHWTVCTLMQNIMDLIYTSANLASHESLLDGFKFGSSASFPGACPAPVISNQTHTATISASYLNTVGRATQGDGPGTFARKPTGCYVAPGSIVTVTVPAALVNTGYSIRVGAHSWDFSNKPSITRLDRSSLVYAITSLETKIASPLGGGIYIEVPFLANAGVVNVQMKNAVRSPYFSAKSFHKTTPAEWLIERTSPAPWADFQTDKFMMQVPTSWISTMPDATKLMADWDAAMDAVNDLMGFPRVRGKEAFYTQVDMEVRTSVFAPGYPSINVGGFSATATYGGYASHYLVRGPQVGGGADIEFHEQGHGYFFPKFGGEMESNVNLLFVPAMHQKFGKTLDEGFRMSLASTNTYQTLDTSAIAWMCSFNFSPKEQPMAELEKQYQLKGHAKFVDIARLYGWGALHKYATSMVTDEENGITVSETNDSLLLRLSKAVGKDIRPLFHFWGIYPENPGTLATAMSAANLTVPAEIYDTLVHYKSIVPADNAAFRTFAMAWWGKKPSIAGNWEETDHAMQWDETPDADGGSANANVRPNGDIYVEASAASIQDRVQELIDLYYPAGRPADTTSPAVLTLSPPEGASSAPISANLVATFTEPITIGTGNITIKNLTDATQTVIAITDAGQVSATGSVLTINPTADLTAGKNFAIQIDPTAIDDTSGNSFAGIIDDTTWNFTILADGTPPTLASTAIVDNKGGAPFPVNTQVSYTLTFSEDMDASTVSAADFGNAGTSAVAIGTVSEISPGVFAVPVTPTSAGTLWLQVNAGAVLNDAVGNALDTNVAITDDTNITINALNVAPVWTSNPVNEVDAAEDSLYSATLADNSSDANNNTLTFVKMSGPAWLSVAPDGTLSGTPANSNVGANNFTVSVSDGIAPAVEATLNIAVINTNDLPVWAGNPLGGTDATEDTAYSGTLAGSASDVDAGATLIYSKVSGPTWLGVAPNGVLSGTPANGDVGANSFTVSVSDGIAVPVQATLNITVINTNDAPVFTANPITGADATEDAEYSGTIAGSATDVDADSTLTYAKVSGPAWLNIATDGSLTGTPDNSHVGPNAFTVSVSDGIAPAVEGTLNITVINTNDTPVFAANPIAGADATEDAAYVGSIASSASDADAGAILTFAKLSGPAWLNVAANGALSGIPTNSNVGANSFIVSVNDGIATAVEATLEITVINTNDAPAWASNPVTGTNATEDIVYAATLTNEATDVDTGATLTYVKVSGPAWLGIAADGKLSGTPANSDVGANSFTVSVSDGIAAPVESTLNITVDNANDVPTWAGDPINGPDATEDIAYSGSLAGSASDVDAGATLAFAKVSGPAWLAVASNGVVSGTPANNDVGANSFTVSVSDGIATAVLATLNITVTNTNDAPVFTANPFTAANANEGQAYTGQTITGSATDADAGDAITYSKVSGPAWLTVASNGVLSGTPTLGSAGLNTFVVRATDSTSATGDATLQITVVGLPLPWVASDIGTGMLAGSTFHNSGTFTQAGSGIIGSTSDKLRFTYQTLTGDGEIIAKISVLQNTGTAARVGVMIRDTLATNSKQIFMGLHGSSGYRWARRTTTGGSTSSTNSSSGTVPNTWVRLVRSGTTITAYKSTNGTSWTTVGSTTNTTFASTCYIGLAVGSGSTTTLNTSQFGNVTVTP